jgi:predicted dehydrogenase
MGTDSRARAAVVGLGYLGKFHVDKYMALPSAELVAVVDIEEARAREFGERLGVKWTTDYTDLPRLGVTCASVVTPTSTHAEIACWLLDHGIDTMVEKPLAATPEDARRIEKSAAQNGRILQVGHLERFNPAFRKMKEFLSQPRFFEVRRISPFSGRGADVDVISDLMIHDLDIVAHLVDRPVKRVSAVGVPVLTPRCDIANARIEFEGGAVANITASRVSFKSERSLRVFQPEVYMVLDFEKKHLKIYQLNRGEGEGVTPKITIHEQAVSEGDALGDEVKAFVETVLTRSNPPVSGEDGVRAVELAALVREEAQRTEAEVNEGLSEPKHLDVV